MTVKIITNDEVTSILGLSSSQAALVDIFNEMATEALQEILEVDQLGTHIVTDEWTDIVDPEFVVFNQAPVQFGETITLKDTMRSAITNITLEQHKRGIRTAKVLDSNSYPSRLGYPTVYASYTAGFVLYDTVQVNTNPSDGDTLIVKYNGTETTYTFKNTVTDATVQIEIGVDADATATNIGTFFGGSSATDTATLGLGYEALTTGTADVTIVNNNIPKDLKLAVALVAGGGFAEKSKKGGIASYTIGPKTVNFRTDVEGSQAVAIIESWVPRFKRTNLSGI